MPRPQARTLLHEYVEAAAGARLRERAEAGRVCELEMRLGEAEAALRQAAGDAQRRDYDYDRRLVELQKEHAKKARGTDGRTDGLTDGRTDGLTVGGPFIS